MLTSTQVIRYTLFQRYFPRSVVGFEHDVTNDKVYIIISTHVLWMFAISIFREE